MGAILAEVVYGLAVAWDTFCTIKVMQKNPNGELNPLVKLVAKDTDAVMGSLVGVVMPSLLIGLIGWYSHPVLYLATGARAMYGYLQYLSYKKGLI